MTRLVRGVIPESVWGTDAGGPDDGAENLRQRSKKLAQALVEGVLLHII